MTITNIGVQPEGEIGFYACEVRVADSWPGTMKTIDAMSFNIGAPSQDWLQIIHNGGSNLVYASTIQFWVYTILTQHQKWKLAHKYSIVALEQLVTVAA